jgi:hypothetical protein
MKPPTMSSPGRGEGSGLVFPGAVALLLAVVHLATIGAYGIFRDEFYYLACGRHPAWGYVDHPPLVALMARVSTAPFGETPLGIRWLSVALAALTVLVTGAIVRRAGGGGFAQAVACLSVAIAPHYLFVFHILSMNSAEILLWTLGGYFVLIAVQDRRRLAWVAFGVVCGIGLLNKHSMLVFGLGITVGLLVSPARRQFLTPWPWLAAAIAGLTLAPHVLWQIQHGWPTLEFVRNAQEHKIADVPPLAFVGEQLLLMHPLTAPVWLVGLVGGLAGRQRPDLRVFSVCYLVVLAVFILQQSKAYYLTPAYPLLLAGGAVLIERWTSRLPRLRTVVPALLLLGGAALAPMALPVLPVDGFIAYSRALGVRPDSGERHEMGALPQHFADMFGWEDLAREISRVYTSLPPGERATARVLARNYGQAGALEHYRARYPLPAVISGHNSYWYWGPGPDGGTLIVIEGERDDLLRAFQDVELVGRTRCQYCMPYENDQPIFVGRGWKVSLNAIWARERHFI